MIERPHQDRLDAVARTYLEREGPSPRLVVVAGEDDQSTQATCRCLQRAAHGIGLPSVLISGNNDVVDLELAHDRTPPLVVYHHGAVTEKQMRRIKPPQEPGVDLLLWDLPERSRIGLRSLYLLGVWTWALRPWQVRGVLPPRAEADPALADLRARLREAIQLPGTERPVELLERAGDYATRSSELLLGQVLQSLLASSARRRAASRHELPSRTNAVARLRSSVAALALMVLASAGPVSAESITVEVHGIDLELPTVVAPDGSHVHSGQSYFLRLQPGVGSRIAEGGLMLSTDREHLRALLAGDSLVYDGEQRRIDGDLVLHSAEFSLQVRHGSVRAGPEGIVVRPQISGPPLPGRQGLFITGVLLVMILLMVWRAASVRRKLDEPYVSVRRRKRDLQG